MNKLKKEVLLRQYSRTSKQLLTKTTLRMRLSKHHHAVILLAILLSGCASIVSKSNWPFSVDSNPSGAKVVITNRKGLQIYQGRTPAVLKLKSGSGFFTKESYAVSFSMDGYEAKTVNVECKLNAWYFGNILIGGVIGMLIVDPATGAMYRLDKDGVDASLTRSAQPASTLQIIDKQHMPDSWAAHLVKLN